MKILGIETSCDETAVAIVDVANTATGKHTLISQEIYSQYKEHFDYGGVVPEIASRAHAERLSTLIRKALNKATYTKDNIDGIAVTVGPGLTGGLLMGLMFAKTLSMAWNKPMIGVNHIEGHVLSPLLEEKIEFPYLVLLVSGGHCQFIKVEDIGVYEMLGGTRDDAAGECFDKAARLLNLGHPGGPALEKAAKQGDPLAFKLPKPKVDGLDFSFSGLKTAIAQKIKQQQDIT
ncbi:MAG: tRNA (adenosine(37)-N6)-threonylcarbamoyltransferase complex transferase subunit TsaD, partial [Alphaproteobacteria bacterium]|nr:tRNA (adenosine(37)-N6)-threonylcarbamoyltransferase complex transferase subunit TsaD [Alphaproteobacteria bacterium]